MVSVHDKLGRIRKPRVHIKYKVEAGDASPERELPFVIGVLGDFAGDPNPDKPLKPLSDRDFVSVNAENFDTVLERMAPQLSLEVDDHIQGRDGKISVTVDFRSINDFSPAEIVKNLRIEGQQGPVNPLQHLLNMRNDLRDLLTKTHRSEELETLIEKILSHKVDDIHMPKERRDFDGLMNSLNEIKPGKD
jgi:type VI secretion system protein ImpB